MNYLLVKEEQLQGQGYNYQYAERIPDGRIILPLSALKVLSNFSPEIISDDSLFNLIKEQKESDLYDHLIENDDENKDNNKDTIDPPQEETPDDLPAVEEGGGV